MAALWGLAEATFLFIVPDMFTSRLALSSPCRAFAACGYAVAGAAIGGAMLAVLSRDSDMAAALRVAFDSIPGISPELIADAATGFDTNDYSALLGGAASGIPYKLYCLHAGTSGTPLASFLAMSVLARALRFGLVTGLTVFLSTVCLRKLTQSMKLRVHAIAWAAIDFVYFTAMARE